MKKYIYAVSTFAFALAMSGLPAVAVHAENGYGNGVSGGIRVNLNSDTQTGEASASTSASIRIGEREKSSKEQQKPQIRGQEDQNEVASSSDQNIEEDQREIHLELEDDEDLATSFDDLKQKIEKRKHQLEQEVASTTPANQDIVENANLVRLAVHSFLASKILLGGIGQQVSEIAKQMNGSVATTTNAEAAIQARGFWTVLLFGGDSAAASVIAREVARNQQHIDTLTKLLNQANVSADIQVTLSAQIAAIQDAQARLQDLAQKEQSQWGLFSWRF